jgi:hypothetical protein
MLNTMVIFIFPLLLSFNKKGLILVLAKSRDTRGKYKAPITGLVIEAGRSQAVTNRPIAARYSPMGHGDTFAIMSTNRVHDYCTHYIYRLSDYFPAKLL